MNLDYPADEMVTPEYWVKRSDSSSYQTAYSSLSRRVPFGFKGTLVDIACGAGRFLAHLYPKARKGILVGTDISPTMLSMAREYLSKKGIPVQMEDNPERMDLKPGRVHLVKDDIVYSRLPKAISDKTFFIFPELGDNYQGHPEDGDLINRALREMGTFPMDSSFIKNLLQTLRSDTHLSGITKPKGELITNRYGQKSIYQSDHATDFAKSMGQHADFIRRELTECVFREDNDIWMETVSARSGKVLPPHIKGGYWTCVMVKNKP